MLFVYPLLKLIFPQKVKVSNFQKRQMSNDFSNELGLFFHVCLLNSVSLSQKNFSYANSKLRIIRLAATKEAGEKIPIFVIGKSKNARFFYNVNSLSCRYSWMLNGQQFIRKMDEQELSKRIKLHYLSRSVQPTSIPNSLRANPTKWSNTLKQFVGKMPTNCLSLSEHFVGLELKELKFVTNEINFSFSKQNFC